MSSIGDPPRIALKGIWYSIVQFLSVTAIDFLIEQSVQNHDRTLDAWDAINVGINVQTSKCSVINKKIV